MAESDLAQRFREAFKTSNHIVVIAGAGLSAASGEYQQSLCCPMPLRIEQHEGIPTFRDGGGMWRSLDAASLATPEAFSQNPSLVWQFYHYRRTK